MSKQKKTKQPPVLGRLLAYAGGHKWLSVLGCGLSGVSAAVGIFPFVFVWYAARGILTPGGGVPAGLARYGWYALAAALLSAAIYFAGDVYKRQEAEATAVVEDASVEESKAE